MASGLMGIGVSGLTYNQAALTTTGNNITNANTDGYTRQRVDSSEALSYLKGGNYYGTGVNIDSIRRVADQFLVTQLRQDTSSFNQLDMYQQQVSQLDGMIANQQSGLQPAMDQFFTALQSASNDPKSLPARQGVLSQITALSSRFNQACQQLDDFNSQVNDQAKSLVTSMNAMLKGLADINQQLMNNGAATNNPSNDLLDKRDNLLKQISEITNISTTDSASGAVNVFVGNGQPLVLGGTASQLQVIAGETDTRRCDIVMNSNGTQVTLTNLFGGGKLDGLISYRDGVLSKTLNGIGRMALVMADQFNRLQHDGIDLNGKSGLDAFQDINNDISRYSRIAADRNNISASSQQIGVTISDTSLLTDSDYMLKFSGTTPGAGGVGGSYKLIRLSDNQEVAGGTVPSTRPMHITADGFTIDIETGQFRDGDQFRVEPTRNGAGDIRSQNLRADALAFASPAISLNDPGNSGSGLASQVNVLSTVDPVTGATLPAFAKAGALSPPIVVRFTSPTTYEVLDNTDPAHPRNLNPPMSNQLFVPGQINSIFASKPGQSIMTSDGFNAGRITNNIVTIPPGSQPANALIAETLALRYTDPVTGKITNLAPINIAAGESAQAIALDLSSRAGLGARASSYLEMKINDDGAGQAMQITLNGSNLTLTAPPSPLTPDYIAASINADASLQAKGISAISNGTTVKVFSSTGVDLQLQVAGDVTDNVQVKGDAGATLSSAKNISNGVDFNTGAPTSFTVDIGGGARTINLYGKFTDRQSAIDYLQTQINTAFNSPSKIRVGEGPNGTITFTTVDTSPSATLTIGGVTNDVLGLAPAAAAGTVSPADLVTMTGAGVGAANAMTVGGKVSVTLDQGYSLASNAVGAGSLFSSQSQAVSNYTGYTFDITGQPAVGDEFEVNFNSNGVSDNRNAVKMVALQSGTLVQGSLSLEDSYGSIVADVGTAASQAQINSDASNAVLKQTQQMRDSVSGVNLDEEAANLIRYQQGYMAASKVISVAQSTIDTLLSIFK